MRILLSLLACLFCLPSFGQRLFMFGGVATGDGSNITNANATTLFGSGTIPIARVPTIPLATGVSGQLPLANGGTAASLSDPNADSLMGWDDTDGATKYLSIGANLTYTHASHTLSASAGAGTDSTAWHKIGDNNGSSPFIIGNTNAQDLAIRGSINGVGGATWMAFATVGNNTAVNILGGSSNGIGSVNFSALVFGGERNSTGAGVTWPTIVGGGFNSIGPNGNQATVVGGATNAADGAFSFAAGQGAWARNNNSFVWSGIQNITLATSGSGGDNGKILFGGTGFEFTNSATSRYINTGSGITFSNTPAANNGVFYQFASGKFGGFYAGTNWPGNGRGTDLANGAIGGIQVVRIDTPTIPNAFEVDTNGFVGIAVAINFTNGSGRYSRVGPYTGPDSGLSIYGTNTGSANALTSLMDVTGGGTTIQSNLNVTGILTVSGASGSNNLGANLKIQGTLDTTGATNSSLTASAFMATDANKAQISTFNGSGLTNLDYLLTTNTINTGVGAVGRVNITNLTGNVTLGGFSGLVNDKWNTVIWACQASSANRTVTFPANTYSPDGVHSTIVTNGLWKVISFSILPGLLTNACSVGTF